MWAVAVVLLAIVEIFTMGFFSLCLAFGALCAAIAAGVGMVVEWQLVAFAAGAAVAFAFVRPVMVRLFMKKDTLRTGVDALVGRRARVSEPGRVAVDGDDWRAVEVGGVPLEAGDDVEIVGVDSATLSVRKL